MSKIVEAEYLAKERILKLVRPLDGIRDHEHVRVVIEQNSAIELQNWPTVDEEAGRQLARAVREAFGRGDIAV